MTCRAARCAEREDWRAASVNTYARHAPLVQRKGWSSHIDHTATLENSPGVRHTRAWVPGCRHEFLTVRAKPATRPVMHRRTQHYGPTLTGLGRRSLCRPGGQRPWLTGTALSSAPSQPIRCKCEDSAGCRSPEPAHRARVSLAGARPGGAPPRAADGSFCLHMSAYHAARSFWLALGTPHDRPPQPSPPPASTKWHCKGGEEQERSAAEPGQVLSKGRRGQRPGIGGWGGGAHN